MPTTIEDIRGAIARGWCHEPNSFKTFDIDLAEAITAEIGKLLAAAPAPAPPAPRMKFGEWCDMNVIEPTMGNVDLYVSAMLSMERGAVPSPEPPPAKCPTCDSPKRSERWCKDEVLSIGPHKAATAICEPCDSSWHGVAEASPEKEEENG